MKMKTKLWSIGNGEWVIHIRKALNKRFLEQFKTEANQLSEYTEKGKSVAFDYIFKKEKSYSNIKKWLRKIDK